MRKIGVILAAAVVALTGVVVASPAEAAAYKVSASLSKPWMTLGTTVTISGTLTPATAGKSVTIERYVNNAWVKSTTTTTNSKGKYSKALKPSAVGTGIYRVKTAAKGSYTSGVSSTKSVGIYTWFLLAYITPVANDSDYYFDGGGPVGLDINGQVFGDTAWMSNEDGFGTTTWLLEGQCMKVKGTAGLDDDTSDAGAIGRLKLSWDGAVRFSNALNNDSSLSVLRDISDTEYFMISSTRETEGEAPVVGYGTPRVFCKKNLLD